MGVHLSSNNPHQAKAAGSTLYWPNRKTRVQDSFLRVGWCYFKMTTYRTIQTTNSKTEEIDGVDFQAEERL